MVESRSRSAWWSAAFLLLSCGSWACTEEFAQELIENLAEALDMDPGETVTVVADDPTPPTVSVRVLHSEGDVSVAGAYGSPPVSLGLAPGTYYWLEVIAEDPEGVRSVGSRSPCLDTNCQRGEVGSVSQCLSLAPDTDWPGDLINEAQPGEQANTRMVWVTLIVKAPTEWTTSDGRQCTQTAPVWSGRATNFSGMSTMVGSIRP